MCALQKQAEQLEQAQGLLEQMRDAALAPDGFTYGTLIDLCGHARDGQRALQLFEVRTNSIYATCSVDTQLSLCLGHRCLAYAAKCGSC